MPLRLDAGDSGFEAAFGRFLDGKREIAEDVDAAVAGIVDAVRRRGDAALIEFTERFDGIAPAPEKLRFTAEEIAAAAGRCDGETLDALRLAADRIEAFHRRQIPDDLRSEEHTYELQSLMRSSYAGF